MSGKNLVSNNYDILDYNIWNVKHTIPTASAINLIENAIRSSDIDGFINPAVVGTLLWLHSIMFLMPEKTNDINNILQSDDGSIFAALDKMQSDGVIAELCEKNQNDISYIFNLADMWYKQYAKFNTTLIGQIGSLSFLTEENVKDAIATMQNFINNGDADKILKMADAWGLNNELPAEEASE